MKKAKGKKSIVKVPSYPRHSLEKALRIPRGILEQNAGKECIDEETATYVGVKYNHGPYGVTMGHTVLS